MEINSSLGNVKSVYKAIGPIASENDLASLKDVTDGCVTYVIGTKTTFLYMNGVWEPLDFEETDHLSSANSKQMTHTKCDNCGASLVMHPKYRVNERVYKCAYCDGLIDIYAE